MPKFFIGTAVFLLFVVSCAAIGNMKYQNRTFDAEKCSEAVKNKGHRPQNYKEQEDYDERINFACR